VTNHSLSDRYRIISTLSSGGFGETFLAEDTQMPSQRRCVIKKLRHIHGNSALTQLIQERFEREAAILEALGSSNRQIPQLYAYFYSEKDQQFYIVQEWIDGNTLNALLLATGPMEEVAVHKILTDILPIFSYIHNRSIIHRDIKPDNIILRHSDQLPVLIDFGAVREVVSTIINNQGQAAQSIVVGTPGYMPSEQSIGRPVYNSDLYSLGLTAIFLLTGKHPTDLPHDQSNAKILWHSQAPQVSPALAQVLDKAISYNHHDRYQNADEFLAALQREAATSPPVPPTVISPNPVKSPVNSHAPVNSMVTMLAICGAIAGSLIATAIASFITSNFNSNKSSSTLPTTVATATNSPKNVPQPSKAATTPKPEDTKALDESNKKVARNPQDPALYNDRAILKYQKMKDYQGALADLDKAISLDPKLAIPYRNRGILKYEKLSDAQGALADLNKAITLDSKYASAYKVRADLKYGELNDFPGALADYNQAISLNPKDKIAYNSRGSLKFQKLNDPQGALADINKAVSLDPKYAEAYNSRGNLKREKLNDPQGALADLNKAITLDSKFESAYNSRGNLKHEKLNDPQGALADYNKVITLNPQNADAYQFRGNLKSQKLNDPQGALTDYSESISLDSKYAGAYYNRGDFHYSQGNLAQAKQDFQQLVSLEPSSTIGLVARGVLALGQPTEAIQYFNQAAQVDAEFGDVYKYRGLAYQQQGQKAEAIAEWRKATDIYSKNGFDADYRLVEGWIAKYP
jgi:serine/threonine protein kinase, bacterial